MDRTSHKALRILHTNDLHGKLNSERARRLASVREDFDLYFDCGDLVATGNLGIPTREDPAWSALAEARCDASTIGNRETHLVASVFSRKIAGARHPLLCANLFDRSGNRVLPASTVLDVRGTRVGVLGVSVAMVTARMQARHASAFLWTAPISAAIEEARLLRPNVDLVIALTHIGIHQDRQLAEQAPEIDVILGGHSHTVLDSPMQVGSTWIAQTGSHGRFLGKWEWDARSRSLSGSLEPWLC